ncbi:MAG: hypothetical protein HUU22_03665 [Phycisphaerae bacterium]|nr:hypothetical protein [Phycisphaerae bacterium]NUQ45113.1 hypothetical protein [Phycisphaerae bacterium]
MRSETSLREPPISSAVAGAVALDYGRQASVAFGSRASRAVLHLACLLVAGIFLYAAYAKVIDPNGFIYDLRHYRLFPDWTLHPLALMVPWWEAFAALALLVPSWRRAGSVLTGLMGAAFFVSVSQALYRGLNISCGCFGHGEDAARAGMQTLALDLLIVVLSFYIFRAAGRSRQPAVSP